MMKCDVFSVSASIGAVGVLFGFPDVLHSSTPVFLSEHMCTPLLTLTTAASAALTTPQNAECKPGLHQPRIGHPPTSAAQLLAAAGTNLIDSTQQKWICKTI